jgi:hypothetical protein
MSLKVNRIELDKSKGLTIEVLNGTSHQKIFLDGDKITITVTGPGGAGSTIEQTPRAVTITADNFIVNARQTIAMTATTSANMASGPSHVEVNPAEATLSGLEAMVDGQMSATVKSKGTAQVMSNTVTTIVGNASVILKGAAILTNEVPVPVPPAPPTPII